ncbi:MAG: hypothetical protein ACTSPI_11590 [Candidatus Heimdallarchaeaceae archaeon]
MIDNSEEKEAEMNEKIKIRLRAGDREIELECRKEDVGSILSLFEQFITILSKIQLTTEEKETTTSIPYESLSKEIITTEKEIPQITAKSLTQAIRPIKFLMGEG